MMMMMSSIANKGVQGNAVQCSANYFKVGVSAGSWLVIYFPTRRIEQGEGGGGGGGRSTSINGITLSNCRINKLLIVSYYLLLLLLTIWHFLVSAAAAAVVVRRWAWHDDNVIRIFWRQLAIPWPVTIAKEKKKKKNTKFSMNEWMELQMRIVSL